MPTVLIAVYIVNSCLVVGRKHVTLMTLTLLTNCF